MQEYPMRPPVLHPGIAGIAAAAGAAVPEAVTDASAAQQGQQEGLQQYRGPRWHTNTHRHFLSPAQPQRQGMLTQMP
jgi:hypothetical protein